MDTLLAVDTSDIGWCSGSGISSEADGDLASLSPCTLSGVTDRFSGRGSPDNVLSYDFIILQSSAGAPSGLGVPHRRIVREVGVRDGVRDVENSVLDVTVEALEPQETFFRMSKDRGFVMSTFEGLLCSDIIKSVLLQFINYSMLDQ